MSVESKISVEQKPIMSLREQRVVLTKLQQQEDSEGCFISLRGRQSAKIFGDETNTSYAYCWDSDELNRIENSR